MKKLFAACALVLTAVPLLAHDFWIEPTTFHPEVGSMVGLSLRVGQGFRGDPVPLMPDRIVKFVTVSAAGAETTAAGIPGRDPAGRARVTEPGFVIAGYRSSPSNLELPADKFEAYLKDEGLEKVIAIRARRGDSEKPSKEIYSRCAKALLDAGGAGTAGFDRVLGLRLELIPEASPKKLPPNAGGSIPVRLLYEGKPLAEALVVAMNRDEPDKRLSARTDKAGRVVLALPRGGVWLVKAVHMVPAPAESGADWESLWASLTFEAP
ncbi:MAG: DUF4198 domain-containing protein [Acidobacteriota bacterium]